jgi:hypothetical protein
MITNLSPALTSVPLCNTLYNAFLSNVSVRVVPAVEGCVRSGWNSCLDYNDVVGFINNDKLTEKTKKELAVVMLTRLKYISEFIACCHRIDLELDVEPVGKDIMLKVARIRPLPAQDSTL